MSDEYQEVFNDAGVSLCVGCRALGRCVLGIEHEELLDGVLQVSATCPIDRQGVQGVAHGGWVADVFDEVLGKRLQLAGKFGVTHSLTVRFHRPTPVGVRLLVTARHVASNDSRWIINGELRLASTGALLADGTVTMALRDSGRHVERFKRWLATEVTPG